MPYRWARSRRSGDPAMPCPDLFRTGGDCRTARLDTLISPDNLREMGATRKPFEADATTIDEEKAFAGRELTDDVGGKNLFRLSARADMDGCMDGRAKQA